ncbi:MAG: alpha/beta hydrolase [Bacteriovoracaceae bacterium]
MMYLKYPNYFLTDDGENIFYSTNFENYSPDDTLLVFNYGLVCSNFHWKFQLPFFEEKGYKMLIHNYRAHYNSTSKGLIESVSFDNIVNDINQILSQFNFKNIIMLGHSMGVNTTLEFAKRFPEKLKGMILISGSVLPPQDVMFDNNYMGIIMPYVEKFSKLYPKAADFAWKYGSYNPLIQLMILNGGFNPKRVGLDFIQVYMNKIAQLPQELFMKLFKEMGTHDAISFLENIETKALIMGGDADKIIPLYVQFIMHQKLKNSEFYIIKDGSHVPQIDFPDSINERIDLFINDVLNTVSTANK